MVHREIGVHQSDPGDVQLWKEILWLEKMKI